MTADKEVQQLCLYNKKSLSPSSQAGVKLLEYLGKHKKEVFPRQRTEFLIPIIRFFDTSGLFADPLPPLVITQMAMQLADFRLHNRKEGYLTENQLSRQIQKVRRDLNKRK